MAYRINESVCTGCDACVTACPTKAISGEMDEPHVVDPDLCVSCGICIKLCTNFAVRSGEQTDEFEGADELIMPHFDTVLCNGCSACVSACPMDVLQISAPKFRGDIDTFAELTDLDRCVGCEKCAEHCPVGAVTMVKRPAAAPVFSAEAKTEAK